MRLNKFPACCGASILSEFNSHEDNVTTIRKALRRKSSTKLVFAILAEYQLRRLRQPLETIGFKRYNISPVRNPRTAINLYTFILTDNPEYENRNR